MRRPRPRLCRRPTAPCRRPAPAPAPKRCPPLPLSPTHPGRPGPPPSRPPSRPLGLTQPPRRRRPAEPDGGEPLSKGRGAGPRPAERDEAGSELAALSRRRCGAAALADGACRRGEASALLGVCGPGQGLSDTTAAGAGRGAVARGRCGGGRRPRRGKVRAGPRTGSPLVPPRWSWRLPAVLLPSQRPSLATAKGSGLPGLWQRAQGQTWNNDC